MLLPVWEINPGEAMFVRYIDRHIQHIVVAHIRVDLKKVLYAV